MPEFKREPWKKPEEVKSLNISGKPAEKHNIFVDHKELGGGIFGKVFIGSLRFKDGKRRRVAIKKFFGAISDKDVEEYRKIIYGLKAADLPVLKTDFVKLPTGEWVQVQELFGGTERGSKFLDSLALHGLHSYEEIKDIVDKEIELTIKVANLGYSPHPDMFVITETGGVYIGDFDSLKPGDFSLGFAIDFFHNTFGGECLNAFKIALEWFGSAELKQAWKSYLASK